MEKKKPRMITNNEQALVKAAAWAWYQRGSGSEGRPMREFDLTRTQRGPRLSRFKIEAIILRIGHDEEHWETLSQTDTNSLLDQYEIEKISTQLDSLLESSTCTSNNNISGTNYCNSGVRAVSDRKHRKMITDRKNSSLVSDMDTSRSKMMKRLSGFWLRHAVGVCGSRQDVVENTMLLDKRQQRKYGSAFGLTTGRSQGKFF